MYILFVILHMELLRSGDLQSCVSGALHLLQCYNLTHCLIIMVFVGAYI
jgi:hypothetical protein